QCLQGLHFLHSKLVIHRDVKSCNILLRTDGSVKLGQYILGQAQCSGTVGCGAALSDCQLPKNAAGGIIDAKEASGTLRFHFLQAEIQMTLRGTPQLQQPNVVSLFLRDFLRCCLQTDEAWRWSAKELLQHPFVISAKPASSLVPRIISVKR
ncbi:PAK3 kinase, partial [Sylvietta virens]|nr:PAK3 kinase [Sylvietta virens]